MENTASLRQAVGCFHTQSDMQSAIDELLSHGFDRAELSVLASMESVQRKLKKSVSRIEDLEDDPRVPHAAIVSEESLGDAEGAIIGGFIYTGALLGAIPLLVASGMIVPAVTASIVGGGIGSAIGMFFAGKIDQRHSENISEQLQRGGLLLWARTFTKKDAELALKILKRNNASDIHIHDFGADLPD